MRLFLCLLISVSTWAQGPRDLWGLSLGVLPPGSQNAITDVGGVLVGHVTRIEGDRIRTGVTALLPHAGNLFQQKVPAAVYVGNGFGKLAGSTQIRELGTLESPIILTNTLSVPVAIQAVNRYTLAQSGNEKVRSVNAVVGETNDGGLNDIRAMSITEQDVFRAIDAARSGPVAQGNVGAGTGTIAFGWKGGIGTSSRRLPAKVGGYTVGVLVQANFGGTLLIGGYPIGKALGKYFLSDVLNDPTDGSCMIIVATDAPLDAHQLERLASRAMLGLARTGGIASNGSGDYVISFSTDRKQPPLSNDHISPLFLAAIEATEEAILNALFSAESMKSAEGFVEKLPLDQVRKLLSQPLISEKN